MPSKSLRGPKNRCRGDAMAGLSQVEQELSGLKVPVTGSTMKVVEEAESLGLQQSKSLRMAFDQKEEFDYELTQAAWLAFQIQLISLQRTNIHSLDQLVRIRRTLFWGFLLLIAAVLVAGLAQW